METSQTPVAGSDTVISGAAANGTHKLKTQYGSSHFGSGGARGVVRCSSNCKTVGVNDNGFVAGPSQVAVIDSSKSARFYAYGSDMVGEGREWGEAAHFEPNTGWLPVEFIWRKHRDEKMAWVAEADATT